MVMASQTRVEDQLEELAEKKSFLAFAAEFTRKQPLGTAGMIIVFVMLFASFFATVLTPYDPESNDFANMLTA
ncbi:MAG: hypothetical protein IIB62_09335, partial [Proteobacteria bacterium]|nr:hypothetical protein [Pseudomonadota bacterium]